MIKIDKKWIEQKQDKKLYKIRKLNQDKNWNLKFKIEWEYQEQIYKKWRGIVIKLFRVEASFRLHRGKKLKTYKKKL